MSTEHPTPDPTPDPRQMPEPVPAAQTQPEAQLAPEAIQAADVESRTAERERPDIERPTRGVDWVQTSKLLYRAGGAVSRRGIDWQTGLGKRAQAGLVAGTKRLAHAVQQRLSPVTEFGRDEPAPQERGLGRP